MSDTTQNLPQTGPQIGPKTVPKVAAPAPPPASRAAAWAFPMLRVLIVVLVAALAWYVAAHWDRWTGAARFERTEDAYMVGDVTPLAAKISGYVASVPVADYQHVTKGELLVEIEPSDYRAQLQQAEANLAATQAALANLANQRDVQRALIRQADATIQATAADLLRYTLEDRRQQTLLNTRIAGTQQAVEQAQANERRTAAQLQLNNAQLDQQKALLAAIDVQEKQLQAQVLGAEAQVALARNNLTYTRILSPADGIVGQRQVRAGQFVNTGTQVIAVVPLPNIWVIANYKETQMTNVRAGQPARVTVDAFPGLVLTGHVESWSPGTGSTFALLPPDNATGNFTKVVQRVPVKIVLDPQASLGTLVRPGMSVEAVIDTRGDTRAGRDETVRSGAGAVSLHLAPVTACGIALDRHARHHPRLELNSIRPYIGILGVLLGSIMGTLGTRVTTFGLADLRGALHAGFDDGAWITTSFGIGQMMVGVAAPYLGAIFGMRRVLLLGILLFFTTSLLAPLSPNLDAFLVAQFLGGVGSGTFIPLTIAFVVRNLPARLVIYGLAVYAMNSELSQNVAASLEGWYTEYWSWHWIDWQYCLALPLMFVCVWFGVPRENTNTALLRDLDWPGLAYSALGFALLYAGLDQGNRLDWSSNGLIVGLLLAGGVLTLVFIGRELVAQRPFLNLRLLCRGNLPLLMLQLAGFRFIILSTAYIIPTYLQTLQNFRELQVGAVLLWIALPQLLIVVPLGWLLRRVDARIVLAAGTLAIGVACLMATDLTSAWATIDFLPSQVVQALGQSFALTALVVLVVRSINPTDALTIGSLLQVSRLFGGEIGTAFMQTFVRVREQLHSNLVGLHVDGFAAVTNERLSGYAARIGAHTADAGQAAATAAKLLAAAVAQQASVLAYIDGFFAAALGALGCLVLLALMARSPPTPF